MPEDPFVVEVTQPDSSSAEQDEAGYDVEVEVEKSIARETANEAYVVEVGHVVGAGGGVDASLVLLKANNLSDLQNKATARSNLAFGISDVASLTTSLAAKADLVSGKVPLSQMPNEALGQVVTVASQSAMLALTTVQMNDVAIRSDLSNSKFLLIGTNPAILANWFQLTGSTAAGGVTSVNGDPGPTVSLGLRNISDIDYDADIVDPDTGEIVTPGVREGFVPAYSELTGEFKLQSIPTHVHPEFSDIGHSHEGMIQGYVIPEGGTEPSDLPDDWLVIDENNPNQRIIESVNTISASGTAQTLPDVTVAKMHDIVLTANCTLTFPTPSAGKNFSLLLRQDGTGSRTVTWPGTVIWPGAGSAPTLQTGATQANRIRFESYSGSQWRACDLESYGSSTPPPANPPAIRGSSTFTSGSSSNVSTWSTTVPSNVQTGDVGYVLIDLNNAGATATTPTGWTLISGPDTDTATNPHRSWLFGKNLTTGDANTTVSSTTSAGGRGNMLMMVVSGGGALNTITRVTSLSTSTSATITIPAVTPTADNSLLMSMSAIRFNSTTSPDVTPSTGWTERSDFGEGRTASAQHGMFAQSKALSGQNGVSQGATTATSPVACSNHTHLFAIPPA